MTKALVGLFGSDKFRLAVSADGSTFFDGLSIDNVTGIVDRPKLPRFKAYTNYDNYVGVGTWTKIGLNNTDTNDQGVFDSGTNLFTAPVDGTYIFGATLLYKVNSSTSARMRGRLVLNGASEIRRSYGEISGAHVSEATALWLQTMVPLTTGNTVELQGYFRAQDGYFKADHTSFWGCKLLGLQDRLSGGRIAPCPPRSDQGFVRMPDAEFEAMLARAAKEGAKRALADVGLDGEEAALDIRDLRPLLDSVRLVRRTAMQTAVRVITTGVMLALLAGIAIKLRFCGGGP